MIKLLTNWIIGIVVLSVAFGVTFMLYLGYVLFHEEDEVITVAFVMMALFLPLGLGMIANEIREWYNTRGGE